MSHLRISALKEFSKEGQKDIYLGQWCFSNDGLTPEETFTPYPFDDRNSFKKSYKESLSLYENFLPQVVKQLNEYNSSVYALSKWEITIGAWLLLCIQIVLERTLVIKNALNANELHSCTILKTHHEQLITRNFKEFFDFYTNDWGNLVLDSIIIKEMAEFPLSEISIKAPDSTTAIKKNEFNLKEEVGHLIDNLLQMNSDKVQTLFIDPLFSKLDRVQLKSKYRWIGFLKNMQTKTPPRRIDLDFRSTLRYDQSNSVLDRILAKVLGYLIPSFYLEDFKFYRTQVEAHRNFSQLKIAILSNSFYHNDVTKLWLMLQPKMPRLIGVQHGGGYGVLEQLSHEYLERKISDEYITWGWKETEHTHPLPSPNIMKFVRKNPKPQYNGRILAASLALPKRSYWFYSVPLSSQYLSYQNNLLQMIMNLPQNIQRSFTLRLCHYSMGWNEYEYWTEAQTPIKISRGEKPLYQELEDCRLFIGTYNSTTILETIAANYPTIMYWDPKLFELRDSAKEDFQILRQAELIFSRPKDAANKITQIHSDIQGWWHSAQVQKAVKWFGDKYALQDSDYLQRWSHFLKQQVKDS